MAYATLSSSHCRTAQLCLFALCLLFLIASHSVHATFSTDELDESKLPGCGHDHVAAEQESQPITYVSLGKVHKPLTQPALSAAAGSTVHPPQPPSSSSLSPNTTALRYAHRVVEVQASGRTTWSPIRIAVFYPDLEDATRYCTAVGQYRPDYYGNSIECTSTADILTEAKKNILMNYLMPEAVKAHAARLMVHPIASDSTIVVNSMPGRYCGAFTVPDAHMTTGVADADFVVYVAAGPTSTPSSFLAWALACQYFADEAGHPAVGVLYFNPRYLPESVDETDDELTLYNGDAFGSSEQLRRTAIHELLHALGFTYTVFAKRGTYATVPSLRGKSNVPVLNGTAVRAAAKAHYGLSDADLFYGLELEDEGAPGTTLSHWKRRSTKDELMAAVLNLARYSSLSIAAMEDLGFYKGLYDKAEPLGYGYNAGIAMFNKQCVSAGTSSVPSVFCDSTSSSVHACTTDRLKIGRCYLTHYSSELPKYSQYFANNPTYGGALPYMDYCPVIQPLSNAMCNSGSQLIIPGSVISSSSRCFDASNLILKQTYTTVNAICAQVHCDNTTRTYEVLVSGASSWLSCGKGGAGYSVKPASLSADVYMSSGTIACPRYEEVCYANPNAFAALPSTTTTTTTASPNTAIRVAPFVSTVALLLISLFVCTFGVQ